MQFAIVLLAFCAIAAAQSNPFATDPKAPEAGRGIFRIYCSPCHGLRGEGVRAPDLTRGVYAVGDSDAALFAVIANGAQGTEMPAFLERLSSSDNVWKLVSYIRSIERRDAVALKGDSARGEKLFWGKGVCGACHRVGDKGGRTGPELSRIGRERSLAYLRASVVDTNADITPGYATITVVTRDGRTISGVQRGYDNFSAQLMDSGERLHSFFRDEVQSIRREFKSVMPETYAKLFCEEELDDLLAYLASRNGKEGNR
jgi:putative heme-binding domain-containing protein